MKVHRANVDGAKPPRQGQPLVDDRLRSQSAGVGAQVLSDFDGRDLEPLAQVSVHVRETGGGHALRTDEPPHLLGAGPHRRRVVEGDTEQRVGLVKAERSAGVETRQRYGAAKEGHGRLVPSPVGNSELKGLAPEIADTRWQLQAAHPKHRRRLHPEGRRDHRLIQDRDGPAARVVHGGAGMRVLLPPDIKLGLESVYA